MPLAQAGAAQVAAPTVPQRRTGLLAWDVVRSDPPSHWEMGVQWDSVLGGSIYHRVALDDVNVKTFDVNESQSAAAFYVYTSVTGGMIGESAVDYQAMARKRLEGLETVGVERAIRDTILIPNASLPDVSPKTQAEGLSIIEQVMAANYGGLPMLYASVADVVQGSKGSNVLGSEDGRVYTAVGTPVAAGAGFLTNQGTTVDGTASGPGEFFVFASGYPTLYRSEVFTFTAPDYDKNQARHIAERIYVAILDAPITAVLVNRT